MSADATLWSSEAWASAPDAYLLKLTREGSAEAFGELWRRHLPAAYAVAGRHRGRSAPEDVVAEAAARVLALIRDGRGPDEHFRAYFLSAVRTVAIDQGRRDLRVVPTEAGDLDELAEPHEDPFPMIAAEHEGAALVREAFAGLSERDQRVLWHTTVEGAAPRTVAPALGMSANAVSVRAMRARESLRALYLDALAQRGLAGADSDECRWTVSHLGALVRGRLPRRQTERAEAHVAGCPHAAAIADDLRQCHDTFPALLVPLVLAAGLGTPGFVSMAALAGLSGAPGASPGDSSASGMSGASSVSGASGAGAVAEIASQVTALVAGLAVTAGVAGALALPSSSFAPPSAASAPTTSSASPAVPVSPSPDVLASSGSPRVPAGSTGRPGETTSASVVPPAIGLTGTPSATPAPASNLPPPPPGSATAQRVATAAAPGGGTRSGGGATDATSPSPSRPPAAPVPTSTSPSQPSPRAPSPTPTTPTPSTTPPAPPAPQPGGGAPTVTARLVSAGDPARISVRVRSQVAGSLTILINNESGSGELTVRNSSWSCTQAGGWAVRCSGGRGQALLDQTGTSGVEPVVVRVTDAAGRTWTETLRPT